MLPKNKKNIFIEFIKKYCNEEWLPLIQNYVEVKTIPAKECIFSEQDPVLGIFFINYGKVKVVSNYGESSERILRLAQESEFLGHRAIARNSYSFSAVALTDVEVTFMPKDFFIKFFRANPDFSVYLINFISTELCDTEDRMKSILHNIVIVRIGVIFCMLIDVYGFENKESRKLAYTLSRTDIAGLAGTTYESVIRSIAKLEEMKLIKTDGKAIIIPKESNLREFVKSHQ